MQALIPPSFYTDPAVFEAEKEYLFSSSWIFAGLRSQITKPDDWLTLKVGNTSVTLQNFDGEIKAFHNVCTHRFNLMRTAECGHGSLRCPYHGWIYGQDGSPSAIPCRPRFQNLDEACLRELTLPSFPVEFCGDFMFIRLQASGPSLEEYAGPKWPQLKQMAEALGPCIARHRSVVAANWKVVAENNLESYHTAFIHPQTLGQLRSNRYDIDSVGKITTLREFISPALNARWKPMARYFAGRPLEIDDYLIHSLFPTFSLDAIRGVNLTLYTFTPINARETMLEGYVFTSRLPSPEAEQHPVVKAYYNVMIEMVRKVVDEDKGVCETVQRGLHEARTRGILSEEEIRIVTFQRHYLEAMKASPLVQASLPR